MIGKPEKGVSRLVIKCWYCCLYQDIRCRLDTMDHMCMVERKVNDVDYVVVTPDRRKQRQLCHINMLKEYHDEEELCIVAVTTLVDKGQRKLDVEKEGQHSEYIDDNGVRLNNSVVLANLKSKLGHLPENESSELECLILEYVQLFPDTPTQTKVICHDVNVESAEPIK